MAGWTYPIAKEQDNSLADWDGTIKARKFIGDGSLLTGVTITLDQVGNPLVDKTFTMANKTLKFGYTAPTDLGFEIEAVGGFSGDLVHIHQHTGSPVAMVHLVHIEAGSANVMPLCISGAYINSIEFNKNLSGAGTSNFYGSGAFLSGWVGIGTATPLGLLDVDGDANGWYVGSTGNTINRGGGDVDNLDFWINYVGYNGGITRYRDFHVGDGKNNNILFVDGSAGNVGIGTAAPNDKLHVAGAISSNGTNAGIGAIASVSLSFEETSPNQYGKLQSWGGRPLALNPDGNNVGIGTTNPSANLEVSGTLFCKSGTTPTLITNGTSDIITGVLGGHIWKVFAIASDGNADWCTESTCYGRSSTSVVPFTILRSNMTVIGSGATSIALRNDSGTNSAFKWTALRLK